MASQAEPVELKETVPLWLAVAITVVVSLPFGLFLGRYNLALWAAFVVWAEYFALGGKPSALRLIIPSYTLGALFTGLAMFLCVVLTPLLGANGALAVALFVGVGAMVYVMGLSGTLSKGSLPYFNGISMLLAVYFTQSYPAVTNPLLQPWMAALWAILSGWLGALLGWFNVAITFPKPVKSKEH